jgi:3-oxoacyl-[acyl-carrier-protein] synthase-3
MWITSIGTYVPTEVRDNAFYARSTGLSPERIAKSAGISTRHVAGPDEDAFTMALAASEDCLRRANDTGHKPDFIISGSYTPTDLIGTIAHRLQRAFHLEAVRALYISTGCSSMLNAMEIAEGYFATGKSRVCLATASEHNTYYCDPSDGVCGHLWGDGGGAFLLSSSRPAEGLSLRVLALTTCGHGDEGRGPDAVCMKPRDGGLQMPAGADVFRHAVECMCAAASTVLEFTGLTIDAMRYFIPHQANQRITNRVAARLGCSPARVVSNIHSHGNTGSAGAVLALASVAGQLRAGEHVLMAVFGGGYSSGAAILRSE